MEGLGKYVWVEDDTYSWLPAKILEIVDNKCKFLIKINGKEIVKYDTKKKEYIDVHPSCLNGVDDLLWLGDFNQQALLHSIRERFAQDKIYSFIGMPILIAVNPYKNLNIYHEGYIHFYKDYFKKLKANPGPPVPHLYYLAEAAYQDMTNEKKNQTIIISGESGSGKTQSAKIILQYLANTSLQKVLKLSNNGNSRLENQILYSTPLLEAFGNAKTAKNNNSSRFGKFIQISFSEHGKMLSARIYNYLLEKSRVVKIQPEDRNYHIFYQFLLGANDHEREVYKLKDIGYYDYLNKGGSFEIEDVNDQLNFTETKECMAKLNFSGNEINYIFSILSGILNLGNIKFIEGVKNGNAIAILDSQAKEAFDSAALFLGLESQVLLGILTERKVNDPMNKEAFHRNLSVHNAYHCRDAIAKAVYSKMFDYLVGKVNRTIANKDEVAKVDRAKTRKIGLLDIFGFENFEVNSFEQLCINYANERLQQYFNNHIFKLEQEEYKKEGIDWSMIEFTDNQDIIQLIDDKKISIFSILDSEGIIPNASDESFRNKVYTHCSHNPILGENVDDHICIYHYAGQVYYYVEDFVDKNIDQLTPDIVEALSSSKNKLIKKLFEPKEEQNKKFSASDDSKKVSSSHKHPQSNSLSKQFKLQLDDLIYMLSQSNPRYVKCIKPNSVKKPLILDSIEVMEQLLSAGVLETIKIRKQGYSIRRTQEEFLRRYHLLAPQVDMQCKDIRHSIDDMLKLFKNIPDMKDLLDPSQKLIQCGHTKIFMKDEVKQKLDSRLAQVGDIIHIQSCFRSFLTRRKVKNIFTSVTTVQGFWKGYLFRTFFHLLKQHTILIQHCFRHYSHKKKIHKEPQRPKETKLNHMKEIETFKVKARTSTSGDGSTADMNTEKDFNKNLLKKLPMNKKGSKLQIPDIFNIENVVGSELKRKLETLQEEIENAKKEKENLIGEIGMYKDTIKTKETEIETLKIENDLKSHKIQGESAVGSQLPSNEQYSQLVYDDEMKRLKKDISEKETTLDILNLKIEDLMRSNKTLVYMNENLKDQLCKRKQKMDQEMSSLYQQMKEVEIARNDVSKHEDVQVQVQVQVDNKIINELKTENKHLLKKIDDLKSKYEKEILKVNHEISGKEMKIKEYALHLETLEKEYKEKNDNYNLLKKQMQACKDKISEMKTKLDILNKNSNIEECKEELNKIRSDFDHVVKKKDMELRDLRDSLDTTMNGIEKLKRLEKALKNQLMEKEEEIAMYQQLNEDVRRENDKLVDENTVLKKENYILKSKLEVIETQCQGKNESELKLRSKEIKELREKEKKFDKMISDLKESLEKKQRVIDNKKRMNLLLVDLAKIKKNEVQCIEGIYLSGASQMKDGLKEIRENEAKLLAKLAEASQDPENTDTEEELYEEGEEDQENFDV